MKHANILPETGVIRMIIFASPLLVTHWKCCYFSNVYSMHSPQHALNVKS